MDLPIWGFRLIIAGLAERDRRCGFPVGSAHQHVDPLVLDPLGSLHHEPDRLLLEETPAAATLRPLLDVIGYDAHRISEIAGRLGQPA